MFSSRTPASLAPNQLTVVLDGTKARGGRVIDLTNTNPTRVGLDYPAGLLAALGDDEALVYDPQPLGIAAAREAVAADYARRGVHVDPARIAITASSSESYALLFKLLCDPGDEVLAPQPSYPLFEHLTRLEAVRLGVYPLLADEAWRIDHEALGRAARWDTRAVVVVSPNNPTGSYLRRDDLAAIASLCAAREMALVGDEVFVDYPLGETPAHAASVLTQDEALAFSLGGFSKSLGLPQLKFGWIAVGGPSGLASEALARLEIICDAFLSASTPVQLAAPALFACADRLRSPILARVRANYEALRRIVQGHPSCRVLPAEGGWQAVIQTPNVRPEETLAIELLEHDRVLVHPGYFFDFPRDGAFVVSLLPPPRAFEEGVGRLCARAEA